MIVLASYVIVEDIYFLRLLRNLMFKFLIVCLLHAVNFKQIIQIILCSDTLKFQPCNNFGSCHLVQPVHGFDMYRSKVLEVNCQLITITKVFKHANWNNVQVIFVKMIT